VPPTSNRPQRCDRTTDSRRPLFTSQSLKAPPQGIRDDTTRTRVVPGPGRASIANTCVGAHRGFAHECRAFKDRPRRHRSVEERGNCRKSPSHQGLTSWRTANGRSGEPRTRSGRIVGDSETTHLDAQSARGTSGGSGAITRNSTSASESPRHHRRLPLRCYRGWSGPLSLHSARIGLRSSPCRARPSRRPGPDWAERTCVPGVCQLQRCAGGHRAGRPPVAAQRRKKNELL
jgi:hypothetical protein